MNTPFGMRAELQGFLWKDLDEEIEKDGVKIRVAKGVMDVGYNKEEDGERAKKIALLYIKSQNLRLGRKITADFNHTWKPNNLGGNNYSLYLGDQIHVSERVMMHTQTHQVSITAKACIVTQQMYDSASFTNDSMIVDKAMRDTTLEKALNYFSDEVIGDDRPLYGVYKAIEVITKHLGKKGRKKLAVLSSNSEKYISDLMETTNTKRHAVTNARSLLSDNECKERAKNLIQSYANSL